MSFADISVNLLDLRAKLAERHNVVNRALLGVMSAAFLVFLYSMTQLRGLYRDALQYCLTYEHRLVIRDFVANDLAIIGASAQNQYLERHRELQAQEHTAELLRRSKEETRLRLRVLLDTAENDEIRQTIVRCLDGEDLQEMQSLAASLSIQLAQKTPEERLNVLLESLKDYCGSEEFEHCRAEALSIFMAAGFRDAREYVILMHDQFRTRARELERRQAESMSD